MFYTFFVKGADAVTKAKAESPAALLQWLLRGEGHLSSSSYDAVVHGRTPLAAAGEGPDMQERLSLPGSASTAQRRAWWRS